MGTNLDWMTQAACTEYVDDDHIFFPHPNDAALEAKEICGGCEVAADCLVFALETKQEHGVWGRMTESERRTLLRRRASKGGGPAKVSVNEPTPDERCGTYAGTRAHRRRLEWLCDDCADARALYENERRRKQREALGIAS